MKKKWIIIVAILVLVMVAAVFFIGKGAMKSDEEKQVDQLFPKTQSVASAPEIKAIEVDGLQLAAQINQDHWERLGALSLSVKVKNTGTQTLQKATVVKTFFDKNGVAIGMKNTRAADVTQLKPGEVFTADLDMISANTKGIGKVELSFGQGSVVWAAAPIPTTPRQTAPAPAPAPAPTPTATATAGTIYTASNYPKNPKTPGEVVATVFFLMNEGKYSEAAKLIQGGEKVEAKIKETTRPGELVSIYVVADMGSFFNAPQDHSYIKATASFKTWTSKEMRLDLVKEGGQWKMAGSNF